MAKIPRNSRAIDALYAEAARQELEARPDKRDFITMADGPEPNLLAAVDALDAKLYRHLYDAEVERVKAAHETNRENAQQPRKLEPLSELIYEAIKLQRSLGKSDKPKDLIPVLGSIAMGGSGDHKPEYEKVLRPHDSKKGYWRLGQTANYYPSDMSVICWW